MTRRTTRRALAITIFCTLVLAVTACIQGERNHTLYLEPDGSVTWVVTETLLRSDEGDLEARREEERKLLQEVRYQEHEVARALRRLAPETLEVTWLRRERPWSLETRGRFPEPDRAFRRLLDGLDLPGIVALTTLDGEGREFELRIDLVDAEARDSSPGDDGAELLPLLDGEAWRVVLTRGRFVTAEGFDLSPDLTVATLRERDPEEEATPTGELVYRLAWDPEL